MDDHDRDVRFSLPDPVLDHGPLERKEGVWLSHGEPEVSVMMQVDGVGAFVRALLAVALTGGFRITFGVWLGVHPDDLQRAFRMWWSPQYPALSLEGRLANGIPPWGGLGAPVRAAVRDPEHTPYCESSEDPTLAAVLTETWPHDLVLDAIAGL